jgi:oxygen-independent coproporphyrinogen III oxidase
MTASVSHLYAHVPFCPSKCAYCAFVTHIGSLILLDPYMEALELEARHVASSRPGGPLQSVYLGGGTPSVMTPGHLLRFLTAVDETLGLPAGCEVTLEAHPLTVDAAKLNGFRAAGATRLSFGAESLMASELLAIGRAHSPSDVGRVVRLARKARFDSINLDLLYGLPGQTLASWQQTIRHSMALAPDHLSCYPLSIESGTVFSRRWREGMLDLPDDDLVVEMYHLACNHLSHAGYEHYEVANWAQPGHRAMHNLAYWHNHEFYAVGTGAHGYLYPFRTENVRKTRQYIDLVCSGRSPHLSVERIDDNTRYSETVMLGLRLLTDGLDVSEIQRSFGVDIVERFRLAIEDLTSGGFLTLDEQSLRIPEHAVPVANEIWERFLM